MSVLRAAYGLAPEDAERLAIAGTPEEVADHLRGYVAAGAEHIAVINDIGWNQACDRLAAVRDQLV